MSLNSAVIVYTAGTIHLPSVSSPLDLDIHPSEFWCPLTYINA